MHACLLRVWGESVTGFLYPASLGPVARFCSHSKSPRPYFPSSARQVCPKERDMQLPSNSFTAADLPRCCGDEDEKSEDAITACVGPLLAKVTCLCAGSLLDMMMDLLFVEPCGREGTTLATASLVGVLCPIGWIQTVFDTEERVLVSTPCLTW
jgi:hypothetical protein